VTIVVAGLGHPDRGDDAVGSLVARRVAERAAGLTPAITVVEQADPADLLDLWAGAELAVLVDAVRSDRPAGQVLMLDVTTAPLPVGAWSAGGSHALGLAAAIELARVLDRLPGRLVLVGVEVRDSGLGADVTTAVADAVEDAADAVLGLLGGG
jgi:hydrogenase maturation protease